MQNSQGGDEEAWALEDTDIPTANSGLLSQGTQMLWVSLFLASHETELKKKKNHELFSKQIWASFCLPLDSGFVLCLGYICKFFRIDKRTRKGFKSQAKGI